ncbi:hypothetical protein GGI05_000736, partial [Coemansia sp. RSA 2603]
MVSPLPPFRGSASGAGLVARTPAHLGRSLFPASHADAGDLRGRVSGWLGHRDAHGYAERFLGSPGPLASHQLAGAGDYRPGPAAAYLTRPGGEYPLGQYHRHRLHSTPGWHHLGAPEPASGGHLARMPRGRDYASYDVRPYCGQPGRRSVSGDGLAAQMDAQRADDLGDRRGYRPEPARTGLGWTGFSPLTAPTLRSVDGQGPDPSRPALELSAPASPESAARALIEHHHSRSAMVECELVPNDDGASTTGSDPDSEGGDSSASGVSSPAQLEPAVEPLRMAHWRAGYQEAGLEPAVIDQILSPNAQTSRNRSYGSIQRRFSDWCALMDIEPAEATAPAIVNFLATNRIARGWSVNTVLQYRSGILDLLSTEARTTVQAHAGYKDYIDSIMHDAIIVLERGPVDIKPVLDAFRATPATELSDMLLARRVCWLLGTLGLMRPADIQRIAADRIRFEEDRVFIPIVGPKERRAGRPIERPVYIARHDDEVICPVRTLEIYFECVVADHLDVTVNHPSLPSFRFVPLLRHAHNRGKALGSDRISNHIQEIMALASNPSGAYASARSVGADLAVNNGVPLEAAMDHANWASPA